MLHIHLNETRFLETEKQEFDPSKALDLAEYRYENNLRFFPAALDMREIQEMFKPTAAA